MKKRMLLFTLLFTLFAFLAISQTLVKQEITKETFGETAFDTDNKIPQPAGWSSGTNYHYDWDEIPDAWTSWNGHIEAGSDSSVRINNYLGAATSAEDWTGASKGMGIALCKPGDYSGSWDTILFKDIVITNYSSIELTLGWSKRSWGNLATTDSSGIIIQYSIDGGTWTSVDSDTTLFTNPLAFSTWAFDTAQITGTGDTLNLRIYSFANILFLDDITLTGMIDPASANVEWSIAQETFGDKAYDTDNLIPQPTGWKDADSWHYDWDEIPDAFTSKNGHIEGGSDSSVRINNYIVATADENWADASKGMSLTLCQPAAYSGSWDTAVYKDINIANFSDLMLSFGWGKRGWGGIPSTADSAGLVVEYKIDNGSWISLDPDTALLTNPLALSTWAHDTLLIPGAGDILNLRFSAYANIITLDDITVKGMAPPPGGVNEYAVENVIVGTVDDANDFTCMLNISYDADSVYMLFDIVDDSIVNAGLNYQVDNIEIYFDMDNSKNIKWPRNGSWMADDPTYDDNDYQLRLVPDSAFEVNNGLKGVRQVYTETTDGYEFILNIAWDSLMNGFNAAEETLIGFDVLVSDNDSVASDAARNQITLNAPTPNPYNDPSLFATFELKDAGTFLLIPDEEPPAAVTNFAGTADETGKITLTWDAATDNIAVLTYSILQGSTILATINGKETGNSYSPGTFEPGGWIFKIVATDNYGNESETVTANVTVEEPPVTIPPTAVDENSITSMSIYPNPATSELRINGINVDYVELFNISGCRIATVESAILNISDLANGVYILKAYTADNVYTTRFVKK